MKRVVSFQHGRLLTPIVAIEFCLSMTLVLWGVYTLSPFYKREHYADAWSNLFDNDIDLYIAASAYIIVGILPLIGNIFQKARLSHYGMGLTFMAYLYLAIAKFLSAADARPAYWLFHLALAMIASVCYLWEHSDGRH